MPTDITTYTLREAAEILHKADTKAVSDAIRRGELKARKLGRSYLIRHDDLAAYIDSLPEAHR